MDSIMNEVKTETTMYRFHYEKNPKYLGMMILLNRPSVINAFSLCSAQECTIN